jgi:chromosome segregation ATPase
MSTPENELVFQQFETMKLRVHELEEERKMLLATVSDLSDKVEHLEVAIDTLNKQREVLVSGLEKYADKNFWIRVPAYSQAAQDLGTIAKDTLRNAYADGNA